MSLESNAFLLQVLVYINLLWSHVLCNRAVRFERSLAMFTGNRHDRSRLWKPKVRNSREKCTHL